MAKKITQLNAGQGFVTSLTTALLVIAASRFGLPVVDDACGDGRHLRNWRLDRHGELEKPSRRFLAAVVDDAAAGCGSRRCCFSVDEMRPSRR